MSSKQCYAPIVGGRCPNPTVDDTKLHCVDHYDKAFKLYTIYKKICDRAKEFKLEAVAELATPRDKITFLNRCYSIYKQAYTARMKHREYIAPECQDYGHSYQFTMLMEKMGQCETQLETIYTALTNKVPSSRENKLQLGDNTLQLGDNTLQLGDNTLQLGDNTLQLGDNTLQLGDNTLQGKEDTPQLGEDTPQLGEDTPQLGEYAVRMKEIQQFKEQRAKDERETNQIMAKYIKENKKVLATKARDIDQICEYLAEHALPDTQHIDYLFGCMVATLYSYAKINRSEQKGICSKRSRVQRYSVMYKIKELGRPPNYDVRSLLNCYNCSQIAALAVLIRVNGQGFTVLLTAVANVWDRAPVDLNKSMFLFLIKDSHFYPRII